jgi:hypothetical protein
MRVLTGTPVIVAEWIEIREEAVSEDVTDRRAANGLLANGANERQGYSAAILRSKPEISLAFSPRVTYRTLELAARFVRVLR